MFSWPFHGVLFRLCECVCVVSTDCKIVRSEKATRYGDDTVEDSEGEGEGGGVGGAWTVGMEKRETAKKLKKEQLTRKIDVVTGGEKNVSNVAAVYTRGLKFQSLVA